MIQLNDTELAAIVKETNAEYHAAADGRVSNSWLNELAISPQEFHAKRIAKTMPIPKPSDALVFGSTVHKIVLEPESFYDEFALSPKFDRRTTKGKADAAAFEAATVGKQLIEPEDFKRAQACGTALMRNEGLFPYLARNDFDVVIEQRINFEINGLPMRCKPDWLCVELGLIIDIKTTRYATKAGFEKSVEALGYHRQNWLYKEAARQLYGVDFRFLFAVVKSTGVHETGCFELDDKGTEDGRTDAIALIEQFKLRQRSNNWLADHSQGKDPVRITTSKYHKAPVIEAELYDIQESEGE